MNAELKEIAPLAAQVGDFIIRGCGPERITEIYGQGVNVKGNQYVCGFSANLGDYPKSQLSFSSADGCRIFRIEISQ